jgi:hypothetical protein
MPRFGNYWISIEWILALRLLCHIKAGQRFVYSSVPQLERARRIRDANYVLSKRDGGWCWSVLLCGHNNFTGIRAKS